MITPRQPDSAVILRRTIPDDAPALARICRDSFPNTLRWQASRAGAESWWSRVIDEPSAEVWSAATGGRVAGLLLAVVDEPAWSRARRAFRPSRPRDAAALAARPLTMWRVLRHLALPPRVDDGRSVTREKNEVKPPRLWIELIAVDPASRGAGIARRILDLAEHRAAIEDRPEIRLRVDRANSGAIRLYERAGYTVVSVAPRALIMRKAVEPGLLPPSEFGLLEQPGSPEREAAAR